MGAGSHGSRPLVTMLQRLGRLLARRKPFESTGPMDSLSFGELCGELERLASSVLRKAGVDPETVSIDVERAGRAGDARPVLRVMVRLVRWDPRSAMRLLLGIAHVERGLHRAVASSWVAESSHLEGLWLHPAGTMLEPSSLRQLASVLETCGNGFTASEGSGWDSSSGGHQDADYAPTMPSRLGERPD